MRKVAGHVFTFIRTAGSVHCLSVSAADVLSALLGEEWSRVERLNFLWLTPQG